MAVALFEPPTETGRGGKLIGAGGGGFLLFYTEDKARLSAVMAAAGLREVRFRYDFAGNRVMQS